MYNLYSFKGSGGDIVRSVLDRCSVKYELKNLDWDKLSQPDFIKVNPLAQVPVLEVENSNIVLTESLAICTYLNWKYKLNLIPSESSKQYVKYLKWSIFLISQIYPSFTYSDNPDRWIKSIPQAHELRSNIDEHRKQLWLLMNNHCEAPYFLGESESLIDLYICVMREWRPKIDWFEENCPRLYQLKPSAL